MNTTATMRTLESRLITDGFTPQQIMRLQALRDAYPIIELVDSQRSLDQLRFLKWRHASGRLNV